jgi:HD superfamily phosphodiesterase
MYIDISQIPTPEVVNKMFDAFQTPREVILHSLKVCELCDETAKQLLKKNWPIDKALVCAAAILHDVARIEPNHEKIAYNVLSSMGFHEIAEVIRTHHDITTDHIFRLDECAVLYWADKRLDGARRVSLRERFDASERKCQNLAALAAHKKRFLDARLIEKKIQMIIDS